MRFSQIISVLCFVANSVCLPPADDGRSRLERRSDERAPEGPFRLVDCDDEQRAVITNGLGNAITMLETTASRLNTLKDNITLFRDNAPSSKKISEELASTFMTYVTLIDPRLRGWHARENKNLAGMTPKSLMTILIKRAGTMAANLKTRTFYKTKPTPKKTNIEFRCGTAWLTDRDYEGYPSPAPKKGYFYDNRTDATESLWIHLPKERGMPPARFQDMTEMQSRGTIRKFLKNLSPPWTEVLAFNPRFLNRPTYYESKTDGIRRGVRGDPPLADLPIFEKSSNLPVLLRRWSAQILIASSSITTLLGDNRPLKQTCNRKGLVLWFRYLECARTIARKNHKQAITEETNFVLLTLALSFKGVDWSTGMPRYLKEAKKRPQPPPTDWEFSMDSGRDWKFQQSWNVHPPAKYEEEDNDPGYSVAAAAKGRENDWDAGSVHSEDPLVNHSDEDVDMEDIGSHTASAGPAEPPSNGANMEGIRWHNAAAEPDESTDESLYSSMFDWGDNGFDDGFD